MAIGGANISRGMGRGAAQVYDTSGPINTYAKLLQQQQLRREKEAKLVQDELSKMTPQGLRQQDVPGFIEQVQKWKDAATAALTEKDPVKKALALQNADREKMLSFAYQQESKDEKKRDETIYTKALDPDWADNFEDGALEKYNKGRQLSIKDPNFIRDISQFEFVPDVSKVLKKFDDIDSQLFKTGAVVIPGQEQGERMGVQGVYEFDIRILEPQAQAMRYSMEIDTDKNTYKALKEIYPDLAKLPKEEFKNKVVPRLIQERPKQQIGDKKFYDPQAARNAARRLALAEQNAAEGSGDSPSTNVPPAPKTFYGTDVKVTKDKEGFEDAVPTGKEKATVNFPTYKPVNDASPISMSQTDNVFSINENRLVRLKPGEYKLTGVGYAEQPGGRTELRATIKNENNKEFLIKPSLLTTGLLKDKNYKAALKNVEEDWRKISSQSKTQEPKPQEQKAPSNQTVKIQLPNGQIGQVPKDKVNAFMKKYPNAKIVK